MNTETELLDRCHRPKRALVIEDEEKTIAGWVSELQSRDICSDIAVNTSEAFELLRGHVYAVVILDLMLPSGGNSPKSDAPRYDVGIDILARIRAGEFVGSGTASDVPVIVVTAVTESGVMDKLRCLNAEHIYAKPEAPRVVAEHAKILIEQQQEL